MHAIALYHSFNMSFCIYMAGVFFFEFIQRISIFLALIFLWALPLISWFWYRMQKGRRRFQWAIADPVLERYTPLSPFHLYRVMCTALDALTFCQFDTIFLWTRIGCCQCQVVAIAVEQGTLFLPGAAYGRIDHTLFEPARLPANAHMPRPVAHALVLSASVLMA